MKNNMFKNNMIAIFYTRPRAFLNEFKEKGFKRFFLENIFHNEDSDRVKALSVALGVFIGISPFWGFHSVLALFLATIFKLNKVISFTFSHISFTPLIPFVIFGSLKLGSYFVTSPMSLSLIKSINFNTIKNNVNQYIIGSFLLATLLATTLGIISYILMRVFGKKSF